MEAPALRRRERVADQLLDAGERGAELLELAFDERRQQRGQHQLRDDGRSLGCRHQLPERVLLGGARQAGRGRGHDEHRPPLLGHRVTRQQRRRALDARPMPALDHEAADRERPHAHRRPCGTPRRLGETRRVDVAPFQRRQRLGDGQRELGARAEAHVLRDRLDDAQVRAARKPQRVAAAAGERQRALRVGALGGQLVGGLRLEHDRRAADRHPEPAEAPRAVAGDREHAQVQSRGRLDPHPAHQSPTAARTWRRTYSIASRSRGPPVLSTSTCSLRSSARTSAGIEHARARREDRRLQDRVARPVEAEELAAGAAVDDDRADPGTLRALVDRLHAHLAPRAGVV